ncbi:MAG: thioesterase family protein [Polyangia bacterium]
MEPSSPPFSHSIGLRWADLDPNGHARHSVYYDWAATVRLAYLEHKGVGLSWLTTHGIGPVLFREEARFLKELRLGDKVEIDLRLAAASDDGRKWRIRHHLRRGTEDAAIIEVDGAWLDLRARKIVIPPAQLVHAFSDVARTEDFTVLVSGRTSPA